MEHRNQEKRLDASVLAIFIEALQQRTGSSGALVDGQSEQLRKMFLNLRHILSLDAAYRRGRHRIRLSLGVHKDG